MKQINVITNNLIELLFTNSHETIKYMVSKGYEVNVIASFVQSEVGLEQKIPATHFYFTGQPPLNMDRISRSLYEKYQSFPMDTDAVLYFPQNYYATYFVKDPELNSRSFIDVVDLAWDEIRWMIEEHMWFSPEHLIQILQSFVQKGVFQDIIHTHAQHIITPSTVTHADVKHHYGKESSVIPFNILDSEFRSPEKREFSGNLLYFGRIDPRKGINLMIKGMKSILKNVVTLNVAGRSNLPTKYEKYLKRIKNERFHFHGSCSADEKTYLFQHGDLFIVPSSYDPFPRTVLESIAKGIPVLASDVVGSAYDIRKTDGVFLFKNDDVDDFVRKLSSVVETLKQLSDDDLLELRMKCFKVSKRFTSKERADKLLKLFSE